jgi:hypothetical protein
MLRTIFMIGIVAIGGLFLLKIAFGILGVFFAIMIGLLKAAMFVALVGAVLYLVIASSVRARRSGSGSGGRGSSM